MPTKKYGMTDTESVGPERIRSILKAKSKKKMNAKETIKKLKY